MPFAVLRIRPGEPGDTMNNVKYVGSVATRAQAIQEIIHDFDVNFHRSNPDSLGGHLEIHEVKK